MSAQQEPSSARKEYYQRIDGNNLAPLWEVLHGLLPNQPTPPDVPVMWHYDEVRPALMEAGTLITAKEAERRVLVLENPSFRGKSRITHSLYAGLQLILPHEVAPTHRHSQTALRFIVEGEGAYTAVDGRRTWMKPGDFIITPPWTWHNHGNESDIPTVWLDGLDLPIVDLINSAFYENYGEESYPFTEPATDTLTAYGRGVLPVDYKYAGGPSPIMNYSYEGTREALETLRRSGEPDACHGYKMRYINPGNGGAAMQTMGAFIQLLPKSFSGAPYRSTDSTVYAAVEGHGETFINGTAFKWKAHDIFVVPSWCSHYHKVEDEAVLFSFSDRPVQEKLGLWREHRG